VACRLIAPAVGGDVGEVETGLDDDVVEPIVAAPGAKPPVHPLKAREAVPRATKAANRT
jgi:hypothetical protein